MNTCVDCGGKEHLQVFYQRGKPVYICGRCDALRRAYAEEEMALFYAAMEEEIRQEEA